MRRIPTSLAANNPEPAAAMFGSLAATDRAS
jgi:hypothetical protein